MRASSFTLIAASLLVLAVNAAPLVQRGSVVQVYHSSENHASAPSAAALETSPGWHKVSAERVVEPTPPGWRRDAPVPAPTSTSVVVEGVTKPTAPNWKRASAVALASASVTPEPRPVQADAPGWKKRDGLAAPLPITTALSS
ncbi:hypothetical protein C8R46DRAFT_1203208 [Mycena filopes]|nr:hypothetical protein C8R46DRAFT_1203208 [Mycena filopes]